MQVPYALTAALSTDHRYAQMKVAVDVARERGYLRLTPQPITANRTLALACYGPSLLDTWELLREGQRQGTQILSMSGATHFLAERGIIPDYHIDMDPRAHKSKHLDPPIPGVHYLMASVCPPSTWEILRDAQVTLWHTDSGTDSRGLSTQDWVATFDDPAQQTVHGGSTIGLTAIHIGGILGYQHFEIHGMDGSRRADDTGGYSTRHAGIHYGKPQNDPITWNAEGRTYHTSKIMANAVAETINTCRGFPIFPIFHGDGLTQALIREADLPNACTANQTEKAIRIRHATARILALPGGTPSPTVASYWDALLDQCPKSVVPELIRYIRQAEPLRAYARYNTGSISLETMWLLRAACQHYQPKIVVEVGTFIGCSTYALQASQILHTCDLSNDCLQSTDNVIVHPYVSSTDLFHALLADGLSGQIDLFFFDGRLTPDDIPLIQQLSHSTTVYLLDDCTNKPPADKGLANLLLLRPAFPTHGIISPNAAYGGRSTLGALIPMTAADASCV